jgi:uncharacterized lipoprotein YbaY
MNRRLHNTASALLVSGTLFVLALVAQASDGAFAPRPAPVAAAAASAALAAPDAALAEEPDAGAASGRVSRIRHSVALPFFSFAPRG